MKYTITHTCGHQSTARLTGPSSDRNWRIERLEHEPCEDCRRAELAKTNAAAAAANHAIGLPPLEGSDKQIAWAESIRAKFVREFDELKTSHPIPAEQADAINELYRGVIGETAASYWIDCREYSVKTLLAIRRAEAKR